MSQRILQILVSYKRKYRNIVTPDLDFSNLLWIYPEKNKNKFQLGPNSRQHTKLTQLILVAYQVCKNLHAHHPSYEHVFVIHSITIKILRLNKVQYEIAKHQSKPRIQDDNYIWFYPKEFMIWRQKNTRRKCLYH